MVSAPIQSLLLHMRDDLESLRLLDGTRQLFAPANHTALPYQKRIQEFSQLFNRYHAFCLHATRAESIPLTVPPPLAPADKTANTMSKIVEIKSDHLRLQEYTLRQSRSRLTLSRTRFLNQYASQWLYFAPIAN